MNYLEHNLGDTEGSQSRVSNNSSQQLNSPAPTNSNVSEKDIEVYKLRRTMREAIQLADFSKVLRK